MQKPSLPPDRCFGPDPAQKEIARHLHGLTAELPLICPHGHVDARMFSDPDYSFGSPADLLIIPDHYVTRMLYSQGIPLEKLGVPRRDGGPVETDHRRIWQLFAENFFLFRGTPSGLWLTHELSEVFGVEEKLDGGSAGRVYDHIAAQLATPAFRPRAMFERFRIEVLSTTDAAADPLAAHKEIRDSGWKGRVIPCFRPDAVVNIEAPGWRSAVDALANAAGLEIHSHTDFIRALENRRAFFRTMGAKAADHGVIEAFTTELTGAEAEALFQRALRGKLEPDDARRFTAHMLMEFARMSVEDGLVMQLHAGALRNHNEAVFERFGTDKGCDIPVAGEFTRGLRPLLTKFGNDPRLMLILFTLDEATYARELAPLAGHYPALRVGPAWWFHDSLNGMTRYREQIVETAGLHNTAGFNDDTRAFPSIPARHDLSRRVDANWIAGLVVRGIVGMDDAEEMIRDTAYRLAKKTYRLE
ncbi:MAG: glucuronate isomerase [Anaerolineales bacterium]|nr:glucuronate isomerase [Anaerolineales bacterium]